MQKLFIIILLVLSFYSCKKDTATVSYSDCSRKTNDLTLVKGLIAGTYNWTKTYKIYFTFQDTLTPQNQGRTEQYRFDKNGTVSFWTNNQIQWTNNYEVDYEFKVSTYPLDSATIVIIKDKQTGQRTQFFRAFLCNDSAYFYNPYSSITVVNFYKRN